MNVFEANRNSQVSHIIRNTLIMLQVSVRVKTNNTYRHLF